MNKHEEILSKYVEDLFDVDDHRIKAITKENALKAMRELSMEMQEQIDDLTVKLEERTKRSKEWCDMAMDCAGRRRELQAEINRLNNLNK
jgi:hypothetical protein